MKPFKAELELARAAAIAAGEMLRAEFERGSNIYSDAGRDIKLAADTEAEAIILNRIRAGSPHPILSEEAGADDGFVAGDLSWVIDPLDGTFNFSRGIPLCCVSIALCRGDQPVLGVVNDFLGGALFSAIVGSGAWRNETPVRVSEIATLAKGALCTGLPVGRSFEPAALASFVEQVRSCKKVRMIGSAALSLALVASGRAEVYAEDDINFWDVAAGLALVEAAGGSFSSSPGRSKWQRNIIASNGRVELTAEFVGPWGQPSLK